MGRLHPGFTLLINALLFASTSLGLSPVKRGAPGSLSVNFHKAIKKDSQIIAPKDHRVLAKRDDTEGTVSVDLLSLGGSLYIAELGIGTPSQRIQLQIDTGSSDAWVLGSDVSLCDGESEFVSPASAAAQAASTGCIGGLFDTSASESYQVNDTAYFDISYGDGSGAYGFYGTDNLTIGDATLDNFIFAVAGSASSNEGVLGIGLPALEASTAEAGSNDSWTYPNLPFALAEEGVIQSAVYSMFLNNLNDTFGTLLFGGYDPSRFSGELQTLPLVRLSNGRGPYYINVALLGFGVTSEGESSNLTTATFGSPALLDSGTTLSYLPTQIVRTLADAFDALYDRSSGLYVLGCSLADTDTTFDYYFDGIAISVPISETLIPLTDEDGEQLVVNGTEYCAFGFYPTNSLIILGDAFLRAAYVVYDLENLEVHIAPAVYPDSDPTDPVSVSAQTIGPSGVDSAIEATRTFTQQVSTRASSTNTIPARTGTGASSVQATTANATVRRSTVVGNSVTAQNTGSAQATQEESEVDAEETSTAETSAATTANSQESSGDRMTGNILGHAVGAFGALLLSVSFVLFC